MPDLESFDPRAAALTHAAAIGEAFPAADGKTDARNHTTAVACGLIYVGDQLRALNEQLATGQLSAIANLLETLDATVNNRLLAIEEGM